MKSKPITITILLGCTLICSVALNVFLFSRLSTVRGQVAVYSNKVIETNSQLDDLYQQISDFNDLKDQVEILQGQLEDSEKQAATLQASLSESNLQIESLEAELAESTATIEELEKQQQQQQKTVTTTSQQQQQQSQQQLQIIDNNDGTISVGGLTFDKSQMGDFGIGSDSIEVNGPKSMDGDGSLADAPTMY